MQEPETFVDDTLPFLGVRFPTGKLLVNLLPDIPGIYTWSLT